MGISDKTWHLDQLNGMPIPSGNCGNGRPYRWSFIPRSSFRWWGTVHPRDFCGLCNCPHKNPIVKSPGFLFTHLPTMTVGSEPPSTDGGSNGKIICFHGKEVGLFPMGTHGCSKDFPQLKIMDVSEISVSKCLARCTIALAARALALRALGTRVLQLTCCNLCQCIFHGQKKGIGFVELEGCRCFLG